MDNPVKFQIESGYANLRDSEKRVADYILAHMEEAESCSLVELCRLAGVSQPTVIRFAKAMGYDGYRSFREALLKQNVRRTESGFQPLYGFQIGREDGPGEIPAKTIANVIRLLEDTLKVIPLRDYEAAVELMAQADVIDIYSVENSNATSVDLLNKLLYLGLRARFFEDSYLQHICAGHLTGRDVAVGISYTGRSRNTVEALRLAKKSGAKTIAVTNDPDSPLLDYADVRLCASREPSMVYGNAIFSRAPQLALVDMLYMGIILRDYPRYSKQLDKSSRLIRGREYV